MRLRAFFLYAPWLTSCVALAEGAREESAAHAPVILPPLEEAPAEPTAMAAPARAPARTASTLGQVPVAAGHAWTGQYACLAGAVDFRVRIEGTRGTNVQAVFELPAGRYEATGAYDPDSGALELQPTRWLAEAPGVAMVGLYGTISEDGALYEGRVTDPSCRWFTLRGE